MVTAQCSWNYYDKFKCYTTLLSQHFILKRWLFYIYYNSLKTVWDLDKKAGRELKKFENRTDKSFKVLTLITQLS